MPTYVLTTVCLQIYNDAGELIRMMPREQAKKVYPELFEPSGDASGASTKTLCTAFSEIKLNKSHDETCMDGQA